MTITADARAAMLDGFETFMEVGAGTANFTVYQTNTALAVFPLHTTPFDPANGGSLPLDQLPIDSTGTEVAGTANRWVLTNQNGDTAASGTISGIGGGGDIETENLTVTASTTQTLNGLTMRMLPDGTVYWEGSLTLL